MITRAQIEKLGALHAVEPTMLSLYLAVPPSANLTARAGELITAAGAACGQPLAAQDRNWVLEKLPPCARDCTGRTVAVFACAGSGLFEAIPLPCPLPEHAVLGVRPHIRPLLLARQRCPVPGRASPDVAWWAEVPARRTVATILAMPPGGRRRRPVPLPGRGQRRARSDPDRPGRRPGPRVRMRPVRHPGPRRRHLLPGLGHRGAAGAGPHRGDGQPRPGGRRRHPGGRRRLVSAPRLPALTRRHHPPQPPCASGLTRSIPSEAGLLAQVRTLQHTKTYLFPSTGAPDTGHAPTGAASIVVSARRPYLAGLTSIFLTSSFFSALRPTETVRMPWS